MDVIPFTGRTIRRTPSEAPPAPPRPAHAAPEHILPNPPEPPTLPELQSAFLRAAGVWLATRDHKGLSDLSY